MKKLLILTIFTIAFATNTFAQDKAADIKKLFELMNTDKMMDSMMENMIPMFKKQGNTMFKGEEAKEKYDKYFAAAMSETKVLSKKLVDDIMPAIYDKHFTAAEISDLVKFYQSSTGKKMLDKTPEITAEMMNSLLTTEIPAMSEKLSKMFQEK
jgi:hypothetical protein